MAEKIWLDMSAMNFGDDIESQSFIAGDANAAKDLPPSQLAGDIRSLTGALLDGSIEPHLRKKAQGVLVSLNALYLEKTGTNPNGSSYEQHYAITEQQALDDAKQLREAGFAGVATDMEAAIKNSNADGLALNAKHAQLLQNSHKQLAQMKADDIQKIKDNEQRLENERSLDLQKARG